MQHSITINDVAAALACLDYECRDTWIRAGMAIKSEFGEDGYPVWDEWSQLSKVYDAGAARSSWKSFRGNGVGIGSLIKMAQDAGWHFNPADLDAEEIKRRREAADRRREQLAAEIEADEQARAEWHERVALVSLQIDELLSWGGRSRYLDRKKVRPFGVRFVPNGFIVVTYVGDAAIDLITGREALDDFFQKQKRGEIDRETISFKYIKFGTLAVPLRDAAGKLWGWQFIPEQGKKQFLKFGRKSGLFHLIARQGESYHARPPLDQLRFAAPPVAIAQAEGYATAASIHQATGLPVAVAFDSGNMPAVAGALRSAFPSAALLMCGDDDRNTAGNPGRTKAAEAASLVAGKWVVPDFSAHEQGLETIA